MPSPPDVVDALIHRLDDEEPEVADAAASALIRIGDGVIPKLVEALAGAPILHREAILRVLSELRTPPTQIVGPVWREIEAAYHLVAEQVTLGDLADGRGRDFLVEALKVELDARVRTIFRLLGAAGLRREMNLVERGLLSKDRRTMAVAVEGVEKVVQRDLGRLLVPLIEEVPLQERAGVGAKAFGLSPPKVDALVGQYLDSGDGVRQIGALELIKERGEAQRWSERLERLAGEAPPAVASHLPGPAPPEAGDPVALTTLEKALFLRKVDLFQTLDVRTLTAIASIAEERRLEAGELLCREGELGDSMFCIVEGAVQVLKDRPDGSSLELAEVGPPEVLGEMALFEDKPRSATLRASQATAVLVVGRAAFAELMHDYPKVGASASRMLSRRLREAGHRDSLLRAAGALGERRSSSRARADVTATVDGTRRVSLRDLSAEGAYLVDDRPTAPGQRLSLTVELAGYGRLSLEGTVRRSEVAADGAGFGVAVAFDHPTGEAAQALASWVEERRRKGS